MGVLSRWPLLLCVIQICFLSVGAVIVIKKHEQAWRSQTLGLGGSAGEFLWKAWGGKLHAAWLLGFRAIAFSYLASLLLYNIFSDGLFIFYFYTQWTCTILIMYFGVAVWISINGIYASSMVKEGSHVLAEVQCVGCVRDLTHIKSFTNAATNESFMWRGVKRFQKTGSMGLSGYVMQILFQVSAPAVLLTDSVYWLVLVPYVFPPNYHRGFLDLNMHTVNAFFLVGELSLNNMPFPLFRVGYFVIWSVLYVTFQWFLHIIGFKWWPYPFLNVSTPWAPIWYFGLLLFHLVCFQICVLVAKLKEILRP